MVERSPQGRPVRKLAASLPKVVGAVLFTILSPLGCKDLPTVAANVCGNGVREAGEDCDGYADADEGHFCVPAGQANQCRYACAEQPSPATGKPITCPDGMSCGPDLGICRKGTGRYTPWGGFVAVEARALQLGDLDGDRRDDLLALGNATNCWDSSAQVLFFDTNGHATSAFDAFTPLNSPSMARLTVDDTSSKRQQIIGGTLYGLATLVANQPGQISSIPYPYLTLPLEASYRMIRLGGVSTQPLGEQILFHYANGNVTPAESDAVLGVIPPSLGQLIGDPVAANIEKGPNSECDELVFSVRGAAQVYALSVCGADNALRPSTDVAHPIATLPQGLTVATRPILADVDVDGNLDLVVGEQTGRAFVSFGRGNGTFSADKSLPIPDGQFWKAMVTLPKQGLPTPTDAPVPLAIGQLDQRGLSDWVLSNGIALIDQLTPDPANRALVGSAAISNSFVGRSWDFALIANLNRDEYLDVLAGLKDGSSLDYLKGTGQRILTGQTIVTPGKIKEVIVGDYDGNQVSDVALIQQYDEASGPSLPKPFSLAIAFSERDEGPTSMVEVAQLQHFTQILSANYQVTDYIEEIGVLSQSESDGPMQLILFLGNRMKRPIASLGLWSKIDRSNPIPFSTAVINRGKPGLLSVAGDDPFGVWYLPGTGTVEFDQTLYLGPVPDSVQVQQTHPPGDITVRFVIGALNTRETNPNQVDDALLLAATKDEQSIELWRVTFPEAIEETAPAPPLALLSSVKGRLTSASSPKLIDLDGDGWRDLAILFDALDGSQNFLILWSANGNFDFANATSVPQGPSPISDLVLHGPPTGQHLYAVRQEMIMEVTSRADHEIAQSPAFKAASSDTPVAGGRTIAIGDVTGDGLSDLAVAVAGGVRLYRQEAKAP